jgi:prepilin-type N-terminal cleavage/methylation domain-containing protein
MRHAFTLIEILIVVVILGILSSVVIPQFASATKDSHAGNLRAQLTTLNRQIELYRVKQNGFPDFSGTGTTTIAGNVQANDWAAMINAGMIFHSPRNPAYPNVTLDAAMEVGVVTTAGVRGVAGNGFCWNTVDGTLYASYFNEASGTPTTVATD